MSRLKGLKAKHIEDSPLEHRVWSEIVGDGGRDYRGPVAHVSADPANGWLYVVTDDYEGHAMMNLETLPVLIKALRRIQQELRVQHKVGTESSTPHHSNNRT